MRLIWECAEKGYGTVSVTSKAIQGGGIVGRVGEGMVEAYRHCGVNEITETRKEYSHKGRVVKSFKI